MREPLPLARVHDCILDFLRNRDDAVLFGAQAVNAYVDESRMTQDVNILSTRARELAEELREHLAKTFTIAARVREVASGQGFRIYQLRQPKNRHLADVRAVTQFPPTRTIAEVCVLSPEELIAQKLHSYVARRGQPKSGTDWRDLAMMLLAHSNLKVVDGPVMSRLQASDADERVMTEWKRLVASNIESPEESDDY